MEIKEDVFKKGFNKTVKQFFNRGTLAGFLMGIGSFIIILTLYFHTTLDPPPLLINESWSDVILRIGISGNIIIGLLVIFLYRLDKNCREVKED